MVSESDIMSALRQVMDPELGRNVVELGMVHDLKISPEGLVSFTLKLTIPGCPLKDRIAADARSILMSLQGVSEVQVAFGAMSEEERQAVMGKNQNTLPNLTRFNKVRKVIAVMSGKGGVGKSSITALLAVSLQRQGYKVGILDADITGPSIPKLFGLPSGGLRGSDQGILPASTAIGIKVISINLLIPEADKPVVWRGPMISGVINQFWTEVLWGKLDYLLVDLPPGTSDAALSVMQNLPVNGVVLVTTPQSLAALVVRKAVGMLQQLNIPVLGVVENMSYYTCPDTGAQHFIFGPSHAEEVAQASGAAVWARMPVDPMITTLCDDGKIEDIKSDGINHLIKQLG